MIESEWKSSVLRCNVEEDDCDVCVFLGGMRTESKMMAVIRILDSTLAKAEWDNRVFMERLATAYRKLGAKMEEEGR